MTTYPGTDKPKENETTETRDEKLEKLTRVRDTIVFKKKQKFKHKKKKPVLDWSHFSNSEENFFLSVRMLKRE